MRPTRSFGFDTLEGRMLLSKVHHPALHAAPVPASSSPPPQVASPMTLTGTLTANGKATVQYDSYGDQVTVTPVSGTLSGVGAVRGTWDESVDGSGKYLGPDSIQLHDAHGSLVVGFDATALANPVTTPQGTTYPGASFQVDNGQGAFAGATASGSIQETTNARHTQITGFTLS